MSADHVKLVAGDVERAARFMALFAGLERAFGQYSVPPGAKADARGKIEGKAITVTDRRLTRADWEAHLSGECGLGVVPIREDNACLFGGIDIDIYPIDHREIYEACREYGIPLILCRSKSGGGHGYLFLSEPVPALVLRGKLRECAAAIGYPDAEVFPKQDVIDNGGHGNWINMPFAGGDRSLRYAYGDDGALTPDEFLDFAKSRRITAAALAAITVPDARTDGVDDVTQHRSRPREYWRSLLEGMPDGNRDDTLASIAGKLFSDRRIPLANIGPMLKEFNQELCQPPKPLTDVRRVYNSIRKSAATIPDRVAEAPLVPIKKYLEDLATGPDVLSDQWLGLEFVERHADSVRYTAGWSHYHLWDGNRWKKDETLKVFSMAQGLCRELASRTKNGVIRRHLLSAKTRATMLQMARENPVLASRTDDWDQDPWLLGTPGGTVDLRTGVLRPSDPRDMITKATAVAPGGDCPLWLETLDEIFLGDQEVIGFVQRLLGYSLTGLTREELLVFFWGSGGNGKGTLIETVLYVVGDYGTTVPMTTLVQRRNPEHPTEIAKLQGRRLAVASETEDGDRWNAQKIKLLTGSDVLTGRFMRNDYFDFRPEFQLIVSSNDRPSFGKVDDAIRRRLVMVPFLATFDNVDVTRKQRLREQGAGILKWMIDGCLDYQKVGVAVPEKLKAATEGYLMQADDVLAFVDDCCVKDLAAKTTSRELYGAFCTWCADHGIQMIVSRRTFTDRMIANKFSGAPGTGNNFYFHGIRKARESDE